jgi:diacylglycerol kinase
MNKKPKPNNKAKKLVKTFVIKPNATLDTNFVTSAINTSKVATSELFEPINKYFEVNFNTIRNVKNRLYTDKNPGRYNIFKSFRYAGSGLYWAFITEPNIRIQITIGLIFFGFNVYFNQLNLALANLIFMAMTCSFEIINTVVENICDYVEKGYRPEIKIIKDMAAGAVFVVSLVWFVIILFGIIKIGLILSGSTSIFGILLQ